MKPINQLALMTMMIVALAGCSQKAVLSHVVPKKDEIFAKTYLSLVEAQNIKSIESMNEPELRTPGNRAILEKVALYFPSKKPLSVHLVGATTHKNENSGVALESLSYEYHYPSKWFVAQVVMQNQGGKALVAGFHVYPMRDSLQHINRFTLEGKSVTQYAILVAAPIAFVLSLVALFLCVRMPIPKRKWLWILFIIFGVTQITVNWTTGALYFKPIAFSLFSAGFFSANRYAPVFISLSLPVGAIVFLFRRKKWLQHKSA